MIRKIVHIDQKKCNGCGACAAACHEGAIAMEGGKARLIRDDYCDGMGDCLPQCPAGAISFEEREAAAYDAAAVAENMKKRVPLAGHVHSCPGSRSRALHHGPEPGPGMPPPPVLGSQLRNWPPQIKLAPVRAPYFDAAKLLVAADCTAYAYANIHPDFMRGRVTLIGCPKLDAVDYSEKLTEIIRQNDVRSVTVLRMEVPCCGGLEMAVKRALQASGKFIPWQVVTVSAEGNILDN